MTNYQLDQFERGVVSLPSGTWRWYVMQLRSQPGSVCELQVLVFANEDNVGDVMQKRIPPDRTVVTESDVREYALNPDERSYRSSSGHVTVRPTLNSARLRSWHIARDSQIPIIVTAHDDQFLGAMTADELAELVR